MQNYTHLTAQKLELKWLELVGRPMAPIGRSLIIKYLLWYEQAKREKISPLGFFHEVAQVVKILCSKWCIKHPRRGLTSTGIYAINSKLKYGGCSFASTMLIFQTGSKQAENGYNFDIL